MSENDIRRERNQFCRVLALSPTPLLPCRIPATNCETLAGFSPQTAKPEIFAAKYA
jgi:hypothetical protein